LLTRNAPICIPKRQATTGKREPISKEDRLNFEREMRSDFGEEADAR
jgi:hypothetical protein